MKFIRSRVSLPVLRLMVVASAATCFVALGAVSNAGFHVF